jgi:hypothetical protein
MTTFLAYFDDETKQTYTYMPAVIVNAINNPELKSVPLEERLKQALPLVLPPIAKALQLRAQEKRDPSLRMNFQPLSLQAKSSALFRFPEGKIVINYTPGKDYGKVELKFPLTLRCR